MVRTGIARLCVVGSALALVASVGAAALVAPSNAHADGPTLTVIAGACDAEVRVSLDGVPTGTDVIFLVSEVGSHLVDEAVRGVVGDGGRLDVRFVLDASYSIDGECRPGQRYLLTAGELSNKGGLEEPIAQMFFTIGGDGQVLLPASTGGGANVAPASRPIILVAVAMVLASLLPGLRADANRSLVPFPDARRRETGGGAGRADA